MANILICDDDRDIRSALRIYLTAEGYSVSEAENGKMALEMLKNGQFHLVLLDIMMPVMDGVTTLSQLRKSSNIPVIMLTAKSEDMDKVLGLTVGADDYVTKPFNAVELLARVKAQLRRYTTLGGMAAAPSALVCGGIVLDDSAKTVAVDGEAVSLTPTEYEILKLLMGEPGRVFSSAQIYSAVWNDTPLDAAGTVAVHIRHLREKIEIDPANPRYIKVVWGHGYKLEGSKIE